MNYPPQQVAGVSKDNMFCHSVLDTKSGKSITLFVAYQHTPLLIGEFQAIKAV